MRRRSTWTVQDSAVQLQRCFSSYDFPYQYGCCRGYRRCKARTTDSHYRWDTDPHRRENANEFAAHHGRGCQQELFPPLIRFAQDWIAVIEGVEKLRQLEGMLGKISRFGGRDALAHNISGFRRRQPELPNTIGRFAIQEAGKIIRRDAACRVSAEVIRIQSTLTENIGSAHHRILRVRAGVSLETQSVFKIEGDHRLFRELKHEIAQCSDGDLRGNAAALRFAQLRMTRVHFLPSRGNESIQKIVSFHAEA